MSRAFVKEQDGNFPDDDVPERPQSNEPNYVTPHGLQLLRDRQHELLAQHKALAGGEDDALKQQRLREVERELNFVNGRLERAIEVDPASHPVDEVRFGAEVEVKDEQHKTHRFFIVGQDEADAGEGRVSWASPLAQAMMGAQVGDVVEWQRPAGSSKLEITKISYAGAKRREVK